MKIKRTMFENVSTILVGFVVLSFSLFLVSCGDKELASGLSENEAQEVIVVLQHYGIKATKLKLGKGKDATWSVMTPASQEIQANEILKKYELPRPKHKGFGEVFSQTGLIPTATEEKAMFLQALQGEIAQTLETVDGVVSARVHIVLPEKNPLSEQLTEKATSGVFIKYRGDHLPLTPEEVKQIVAHAVDGLDENNVAVVMKPVIIDLKGIRKTVASSEGPLGNESAKIIILVLGLFCIILAGIIVFLVFRIKNEKEKITNLRRELTASSTSNG